MLTASDRRRSLRKLGLCLGVLRVGRTGGLAAHDLRAHVGDGVISGMLRDLNLMLVAASQNVVLRIASLLKLVCSQ